MSATAPATTPVLLRIPVAGPFLAARTDWSKDNRRMQTLSYVDGGLQIVGRGLVIASFICKDEPERPSESAA